MRRNGIGRLAAGWGGVQGDGDVREEGDGESNGIEAGAQIGAGCGDANGDGLLVHGVPVAVVGVARD